jgi:hypothetical protein
MSKVLFSNYTRTTLAAGVQAAKTALSVDSVVGMPTIAAAGEYFYMVLVRLADNEREIVKVTGVAGSDLTVERGIGGLPALDFIARDRVEMWLTAEGLNDLRAQFVAADASITETQVIDGVITMAKLGPDVRNILASLRVGDGTVTVPKLGADVLSILNGLRLDITALQVAMPAPAAGIAYTDTVEKAGGLAIAAEWTITLTHASTYPTRTRTTTVLLNPGTTVVNRLPPAHTGTYVKANDNSFQYYAARYVTDPANSLTGSSYYNSWKSSSAGTFVNDRFNIDLGTAYAISKITLDNYHSSGNNTEIGVKGFEVYGSNTASDFDVTAGNGTWVLVKNALAAAAHVAADTADPQVFTFTNTTAYRYWSIKILSNQEDTAVYVGLRRIVLQEVTGANVWNQLTSGLTITPLTATTSKIANSSGVAIVGTLKAVTNYVADPV